MFLKECSEALRMVDRAPRPIVQGRHLIERGHKPGSHFSAWLEALFEHQLNGDFSTLEEAESFIRDVCDM